jgi:hypothetical protein
MNNFLPVAGLEIEKGAAFTFFFEVGHEPWFMLSSVLKNMGAFCVGLHVPA